MIYVAACIFAGLGWGAFIGLYLRYLARGKLLAQYETVLVSNEASFHLIQKLINQHIAAEPTTFPIPPDTKNLLQ